MCVYNTYPRMGAAEFTPPYNHPPIWDVTPTGIEHQTHKKTSSLAYCIELVNSLS